MWAGPLRRALFDAMRPHLEDAVYVNNLGVEGQDRVRAAKTERVDRRARSSSPQGTDWGRHRCDCRAAKQ